MPHQSNDVNGGGTTRPLLECRQVKSGTWTRNTFTNIDPIHSYSH